MRYWICLVSALLATACAAPDRAPAPSDPGVTEQVRRVAAILDYIAADYPGAVDAGEVVSRFEYEEQLVFLDDADRLAAELPASEDPTLDLPADLARVRELVVAIAPGEDVTAVARAARKRLLDAYGVVLAPPGPPSLARGRQLYIGNCVPCHGETGAGDGLRARELDPKPRSFHDPEVMSSLTPARAFSALTDGLEGTAMASYGLLPPSDRWSLAFYVFTLRHDELAVERGAAAYERSDRAIAATATRLAGASDGEILAALDDAGLDRDARFDALAFLRGEAPYHTTGAPLDTARERLAAAVTAYEAGDPAAAHRELNAAYLDGFEPHEASLQANAAELVDKVEAAFLGLRAAIDSGAPLAGVEQRALHLGTLLDAAEERLSSGGGVAFASSFVIILREGLEGALLVLLLLGWARQSGADRSDRRAVHAGWLAAVGLGAVTWVAAGSVIARLGGANREIIEGAVALLAAVVLLAASHFVLARLDAKRRVAALRDRLQAAISTPRRRLVLASLAFVAVYREAFEVVLFLKALLLDASASSAAVFGGAAAAAALLVVLVLLMSRAGRKLRPAPLLTGAGALMCLLAVVLAGKGVRALQEAAVIGIQPLAVPKLDWLGLYPTQQTVGAQALVLTAFAVIAVVATWGGRRPHEPQAAPTAG